MLISFIWIGCNSATLSIERSYSKKEVYITMRDGVRLFTAIYTPLDQTKKYPILLQRTPYRVAPYGEDKIRNTLGPSARFTEEGYIFVYQDVRGRFMSEGEYVNMRPFIPDKQDSAQIDESSDTYDTIDWLIKNLEGHNNRVGMWGISYPGFYTAMGMLQAHPALKAVSPQAPITDWFIGDDMHHHGAFSLALGFNFFSTFGIPRDSLTKNWPERFKHGTPDGYDFFLRMGPLANANKLYFHNNIPFWNDLMTHGNYDSFWQSRNILPHMYDIRPAVLTVGGWFDAEDLYGSLHLFQSINADSLKTDNHFVMGPWFHGGWARSDGQSLGDIDFGTKTSHFYQNEIEFPFFQYHLKQDSAKLIPKISCFDTGLDQWQQFEEWPPQSAKDSTLYLANNGQIGPIKEPVYNGFDSYTSDPAHPVPFINKITNTWDRTYMTADQRYAACRPDVLTYRTPVLDTSLTIAGPLEAELYVSTSGTDSDWIVKVIDVYPDSSKEKSALDQKTVLGGYQQLLRGEILRAKYRNSYENPQTMIPGKVTKVVIPMQDVLHTFKTGHRLMIQIQSSWFPLFDRNPQTFTDIYSAGNHDFIKTEQKVFRTSRYPSQIRFKSIK